MIDRQKLETVLGRRFPGARLDQIAWAANAIVGLEGEWGEPDSEVACSMPTRRLNPGETRGILEAIFDAAIDGIIVIDARAHIEAFNPGAERLFGYSQDEVLGQNVSMLMPSPYREEHDRYVGRYLASGEKRIIGIGREVTGRRKDGSTFPLHLSVGEMRLNGESKFTGILHDLTSRVQLEQRLREQAALTRLGEMAAVVAHEVKNPLTGIRGAIQVIGGRLPAGSKDAAIAKEIVSRIDALNDLMKDLLLFARPPQPHMATIDPLSLARTVADLVHGDPALSGLTIEVTGSSVPVTADGELMKIVLHNLLLNAGQATQGTGHVRIHITSERARCRIAVSDNGPGIPPHVREELFTPFFTTKSRGTGLGLSTARRFLEAHSGTIAVDCPREGGTIVTLELPTSNVVA